MTPERERLKAAVDARTVELRLRLREVASRAHMSEPNLYRIRTGETITRAAKIALEEALEWEPGSIDAILAGGEPTVRRQDSTKPSGPVKTPATDALASDAAELPPAIQLILADGKVLDYDLITFPGDGAPSAFMVLAHESTYADEESRAELRRRLQEFRRIAERVRKEVSDLDKDDTPPDAQD
jgi:hypothetical protein